MRRSATWVLLIAVITLIAGCGTVAVPQNAGNAATINLSLTTVPTIRSVTVSPAKASFGSCAGGMASQDTHSTSGRLGFPNGECFVGLLSPGIYPITITNTGIASDIFVNGSSANPSDDGSQWALCNVGRRPAVACTGRDGRPGADQYLVENFSPVGERTNGITDTPTCDLAFGGGSRQCWAVEGASQSEGIELIGPYSSSDTATKWTLTITWTPVPSQG